MTKMASTAVMEVMAITATIAGWQDQAMIPLSRECGTLDQDFLLTLFISRGIPMLLGGDEFRRSQRGNNNPYCQDNEVSWV